MNKQRFQEKIGKRIAALRSDQGLSQVQFAGLLGMEKQNVNRIEKGRTNPTAYTLKLIADVLDIPISKIFDFKD